MLQAACFLLLVAPCATQSQRNSWFSEPKLLCVIDSKEISESSGIAPSYRFAGQYFTHNDSGDTARFFRFNTAGKVTATYELPGVKAIDWEDMASAKIGGKPFVFLADIGDNIGKRTGVAVYRVPEPNSKVSKIGQFETYNIRYDDGPHNAEALLVQPGTGDLYIVTKEPKKPSGIYFVPSPRATGSYSAKRVGELSFKLSIPGGQLVTGGAFAPDGRHVIIRTYWTCEEFSVPGTGRRWYDQLRVPVPIAAETQGESICYSLDGRSLLTTSEGSPCKVSIVHISR